MEVNFDGLRKHLINDYNLLVKKLNRSNKNGKITIESSDIERDLDGLRNGLVSIAFMYQDGEDGFKELPEDTHFEDFNPIEENE